MRSRWLVALVLGLALVAGCGWSPPSAPPQEPDRCAASDGPTEETVKSAIAKLPNLGEHRWSELARGHAQNCQLYWVQVIAGTGTQALQHVLFFDRNTSLGTATPEARPYTLVTSGTDTVTVQYQWRQNNDPPCCPTGIGTARFTIEDGKLKALDPIPSE